MVRPAVPERAESDEGGAGAIEMNKGLSGVQFDETSAAREQLLSSLAGFGKASEPHASQNDNAHNDPMSRYSQVVPHLGQGPR